MIVVRGPHVDTGKYFLEIRYDQRASSKKADRKMITSEHENYPGAPSFLGCILHADEVVVHGRCLRHRPQSLILERGSTEAGAF